MKRIEKDCMLSEAKFCPIPIAEDRLEEALHFMEKLEVEYHDPRLFRFNLNAFLGSVRSTVELLIHEMEPHISDEAWVRTKGIYREDEDLKRIANGRNITLHQRAIFDGSRVLVGLYRGRRHKLSVGGEVAHDRTSSDILKMWQESEMASMFLDEDRSDVGEQYGVWRTYEIKALSPRDDALVACWKAMIRTIDFLNDAHRLRGHLPYSVPAEKLLANETMLRVTVLLESDVDPSLPEKWGWT